VIRARGSGRDGTFEATFNESEASMDITRRDFVKASAAAGTALVTGLGFDVSAAQGYARELRIKGAKETTSICCFCSVGCGLLVHTRDGKVINIEGDPEHPISEGSLCSKGSSIIQVVNNPHRVMKPRYRAPRSAAWKEVEWDWALDQIAHRVKDTRDRTFKTTVTTTTREQKPSTAGEEAILFPDIVTDTPKTYMINRTDAIAHIGSAALDNEECYLVQKLVRSWGVVHIEHQARL
jgi:formate dehydrogenase major subunit